MREEYQRMYGRARHPEDLPWHRETAFPLLVAAADRVAGGRALDLGCGTGTYATYLASRGLAVTAIDFTPRALDMARERASSLGVPVEFVEADVLEWDGTGKFDLVLDSGCLHGISGVGRLAAYKQRLLEWLAHDGQYVLSHFVRRHWLDWRPVGPRRRTREEVTSLFAPELVERDYTDEVTRAPLPIGPTFKIGHYLLEPRSRPSGSRQSSQ